MPDCSGVLVVTNARAFYTTRSAAGALASGIPRAFFWRSPAPFRGWFLQASGASRREKIAACWKADMDFRLADRLRNGKPVSTFHELEAVRVLWCVGMAGFSVFVSGLWRNAVCSACTAVVYRCLAGEWRKL